MSTHNIGVYEEISKIITSLSSNIIKYTPYSSAEQVFSFYDYREESSAFIAFLGSALSVALVLIFVPKYSKRAKAEGKIIHNVHFCDTLPENMFSGIQIRLKPTCELHLLQYDAFPLGTRISLLCILLYINAFQSCVMVPCKHTWS